MSVDTTVFKSLGIYVKEDVIFNDVNVVTYIKHTNEQILDTIDIEEIENYLRKKKLDRIKNGLRKS